MINKMWVNDKIREKEDFYWRNNIVGLFVASSSLFSTLLFLVNHDMESLPTKTKCVVLSFILFDGSFVIFFIIQCICFGIIFNKIYSLEGKFNIFEIGYFSNWLFLSIFYIAIIIGCNVISELKNFFTLLGSVGTMFYIISAICLCLANLFFCKKILNNRKFGLLFVQFIRSIITALMTWIIIYIYIYNNISNNKVPIELLLTYIIISTFLSFFYPLIDLYQYTFGEVEKLEKQVIEKYKYDFL